MKRLMAVLIVGCIALAGTASGKTLSIVTSFTILGDMTQHIGGDQVTVKNLVGPNGDPHVYEPTPQDAQALAKADLVIVSGLGLEGWIDRLIEASGYGGEVLVASNGITTRKMEEDGREITDPHAWNDPKNGIIYVQNITAALTKLEPASAAFFQNREKDYEQKLQALEGWAQQLVLKIPVAKRKVITSHDAFGYLGAAYNIEFHAPVGISTESEASAADVAQLIDQIKKEGIKALFLENSTDPRMVKQIASETGAQFGGTLYAESLSETDGPVPTYIDMLRHNIKLLAEGMALN